MSAEELQLTDLQKICTADKLSATEETNCDSIISAEKEVVIKKPKRVLHFSDGVLEEYSTDDEDQTDKKEANTLLLVDPKSLTWKPWLWYWMVYTGSSALQACDYLGESVANFLGITSPKYQYEIDEYHRIVAEEEEEKRKEKEEMAGWSTSAACNEKDLTSSVTHPPSPSHNAKNWVDNNKGEDAKDEKWERY